MSHIDSRGFTKFPHYYYYVPDSICCSKLLNSIFTLSFHFSTSLPSVPLYSFNSENSFTPISSSHFLDSIALCAFYLFISIYLPSQVFNRAQSLSITLSSLHFLSLLPVYILFIYFSYSLSRLHIFLYIISLVYLHIKSQLQNIEDKFKRVRHN